MIKPLPVDLSFYLTSMGLEDYYADGGTLLDISERVVTDYLTPHAPNWKTDPGYEELARALPLLAVYTYRQYAPVLEAFRTESSYDAPWIDNSVRPILVHLFLGVITWITDDDYMANAVAEALTELLEDIRHARTNEDDEPIGSPLDQQLYQMVMAFQPLLEKYVQTWYSSRSDALESFDRQGLLAEALTAAEPFTVTAREYLDYCESEGIEC